MSSERERSSTRTIGIAAAGLVAGAFIGHDIGLLTEPQAPQPAPVVEHSPVPRHSASQAPQPDAYCAAPSPTDIRIATNLLSQSQFKEANQDIGAAGSEEAYYRALGSFDHSKAKKYGVHIHEYGLLVNKLYRELSPLEGPHTPYSTVIRQARTALAGAGIHLDFGKPGADWIGASEHFQRLNSRQQKGKQVALASVAILRSVDRMPEEYFRFSGLRHIVLATGTHTSGAAAYAITDGKHDTIVEDLALVDDVAAVTAHETTHLLDAAECGTDQAATDPGFEALNNGKPVYDHDAKNAPHAFSLYDYEKTTGLLRSREYSAADRHHWRAYCRFMAKDQAAEKKVVTVSDYHSTVVEEKAETGKYEQTPWDYRVVLNPYMPTIYNKFRFMFARLYHHVPNVARYLAAISTRPEPEQSSHC